MQKNIIITKQLEKIKKIDEHLNETFQCLICGKESITLGIHGRHMKAIHNDPTYHDKWESWTQRKKELLVDKKLIKREIKEIKSVRKNCPHCNKKLTLKMYDRHINICTFSLIQRENYCKLCKIQFPNNEDYKYHLSSKNRQGCSCLKVNIKSGIPVVCGHRFYKPTDKAVHSKNHKLGIWFKDMESYNKAHNIKKNEIDMVLLKKNQDKLTFFFLGIYPEYIKIDEIFKNCWEYYEPEIQFSDLNRRIKINIPEKYQNDLYYGVTDCCIYFINDEENQLVFKRRSDDNSFLPVHNIVELFKEPYVPPPRIEKVYTKCAEELKAEQEIKIQYG